MAFLAEPIWWLLLLGASIVYAIWFRWGTRGKGGNLQQIGRIGYFALVATAFLFNGWPGGVAICIASGVVGQLLPFVVTSVFTKPVAEPGTRIVSIPRPVEPLGRRAVLQDMIRYGISRPKVRALLRQGRLIAYEDPEAGTISLVRPEDAAAVQSARGEDQRPSGE